MDSSGEPLSIGQTLGNLERAAQEIRRSGVFPGAQVGSVSAVVPSEWSILMLWLKETRRGFFSTQQRDTKLHDKETVLK